ncbi:MAG: hypothetical protein HYV28_17580 [Ignavibacteriales bacterium]|nr:hypothetical protein [Ignavibacteriales bacterium]
MNIRLLTFFVSAGIGFLIIGYIIYVSFINGNVEMNLGGILLLAVIITIVLRWYFSTINDSR